MDRTNATSTAAGLLRPDELARHAQLERIPAGPELAHWVENHWCLRWDLPPGTHFVSQTLPHPACNVTVEHGRARPEVGDDPVVVTGVVSRRFDVSASGRCWVLGVKFRPGGLAALTGVDARSLTDRTVPASSVLPAGVVERLRDVRDGLEPTVAVEIAEAALAPLVPQRLHPAYEEVLDVVSEMLGDRTILRVSELVQRRGVSRRRLERLFARYVGVTPKWVLARYRMHDVVSALDSGYGGSLADLAATYGWYDQAHFARDFAALVGCPPGEYRRLSRARPVGTTR